MIFRRVCGLAAMALAIVLWMSCGQVYRPVVLPINPTPPSPANFHAVFVVNSDVVFNPGALFQIDVSGDTNIGQANVGESPTHAAVLSNDTRVFVASAGSLFPGDVDLVTAFTPAADTRIPTGLGTPSIFTFPDIGPSDPATGQPEWTCSYLPDYLATTQTSAMFVANYGVENSSTCTPEPVSTDSVMSLNVSTGSIGNTVYLPAGSHPVALAETPDGRNLYVLNQSTSTVMDLSPADLSTLATLTPGVTPVWAVARGDSQRVYVLTQGDGKLVPIDTNTNTILPSLTNLSVGVGANFVLYDSHLNRLYVTNPTTSTVYVYSATGGTDLSGTANDTPSLLATIVMTAGANPPCPNGCAPTSVAALPDGSRFYVASYASESGCSDPNVGTTSPCIIPMITIFDALSLTPKQPPSTLLSSTPSMSLLSSSLFSASQYAVSPVTGCIPAATYSPGTTRFRVFTTASEDGSHVYVSMCDAGAIADIITVTSNVATEATNAPDTLITDLPAPLGSCAGANCNTVATITSFSITSGVATFAAANNFIPGARVAISGLSSSAGQSLDGLTLNVLATGLSATQFECYVPGQANVGTTADTGTAVPINPPQTPVFLVTGQ